MSEKRNQAIQSIMQTQEIKSAKNNLTRGRSIVCGTCFNGMVEVLIRGDGNEFLWVVLSPGETGELIHQLTASIGCTATITPRTDFLRVRNWNQNKQEEQENVVATKENINQPSTKRTAKTA
jgi:hypothetical protein